MEKAKKAYEICATCKQLEIIEKGREFPMIIDTEYYIFKCSVLGWQKKESPLMTTFNGEIIDTKKECPYWKSWEENE